MYWSNLCHRPHLLSIIYHYLFPTSHALQAEQQKQAAVISAEGDSVGAKLIASALSQAGEGLIELRKVEAAEEIAATLAKSRNVVYLPSGQQTLLALPQ